MVSTHMKYQQVESAGHIEEPSKQAMVDPGEPVHGAPKKVHKKSDPALMQPCFQIKDIDHEGWLTKQGGSGITPKNWRKRWMVLKEKKLYYYKTAFDVSAMGVIELPGYTIEDCSAVRKPNAFMATKPGQRTYYFYADTSEEMIRWIQVLREASAMPKGATLSDQDAASS